MQSTLLQLLNEFESLLHWSCNACMKWDAWFSHFVNPFTGWCCDCQKICQDTDAFKDFDFTPDAF